MSVVQMRPTFLMESKIPAAEIMSCVRQFVENHPDRYGGQFTSHHAMISIDPSQRHFWSPWLHLEVREQDSSREVFCRFSPHPTIWTGIMFSYLAIAVLIFFSLILGVSQQIAGESAWSYYLAPGLLLLAVMIWLSSKAGQKLAQEQMHQMREEIGECLDSAPFNH